MIGRTPDHYRIDEKIGSGGMGEIYRARDQHLPRDVAIKVIAAGCLGDQSARRRFRVEALALSKLNHPNIETAYDFQTEEGIDFLVVEYIPGVALKDKIADDPLTEKEIAHLGLQLADGLCAAHQHGVVHRDLKPGNIMVTTDERLKILDFGLAKLMNPPDQSGQVSRPTASEPGAGTLAYMAPEQLNGQSVDHRTDIYAVGTILYEAAVGSHPFRGSSVGSLVEQILHYAPAPPGSFRTTLSGRLEEIILKCLEKNPENRYQSARELLVDMRRLAGSTEPLAVTLPRVRPKRSRRTVWVVLALAAVAVLSVNVWRFWSIPATPGQPFQVTRGIGWEGQPVIAPDGGRIAFVSSDFGNPEICLVDIHGGHPLRLTNDPAIDRDPTWFPDGGMIAFASDRAGKWGIWKVEQYGGDATPIVADAREPAISPDGQRIAFARYLEKGYLRIGVAPLSDPSQVRILTGDQDGFWDHEDPAWSPDGQTICYTSRHGLWLVPSSGGKAWQLTTDGELDLTPVWSPDGRRIYFASNRGSTLALWRMAAGRGTPERITMGMGPESHPSISRDGSRLAYSTEAIRRGLVILDRINKKDAVLSDSPRISWFP
jgi:Tol biopolymer transport system component